VSKQQLHAKEILRLPVDQRDFRALHGMSSIARRIESYFLDPALQNPSVLPGALVCRAVGSARNK
jgi:hypothetical protein